MRSVFPKACPAIQKIFEEASAKKIMIVPIDYAKRTHTAMACNGQGTPWRAPFSVENNPAGVAFLRQAIEKLRRKHGVAPEHVLVAGEDSCTFTFNFIHALCIQGLTVIGLNARDAKIERSTLVASTDKIDLQGVVSLILKRQGRLINAEPTRPSSIRQLTHHRTSLVSAQTASKLRIHALADQLLPGFLDPQQSIISPFSEASLWLMSERFSPAGIRSRRLDTLESKLRDFHTEKPLEAAEALKRLAQSVLPPPAGLCEALQYNLAREVEIYAAINLGLNRMTTEIAKQIAPTSAALLTTIPAIAIPSAAGFYAELADPNRQRGTKRMTSYAGIVAALKQTGGPEKEARTRRRKRRANQDLKNHLYMLVRQIKLNGHPEFKEDYARREEAGQDVRFTMARRMLRIILFMLNNNAFFLPPSLLDNPSPHQLRDYYQKGWKGILIKWRNAGAIKEAFAPNAPLEQWRVMINELYGLNLSKSSPQHRKET